MTESVVDETQHGGWEEGDLVRIAKSAAIFRIESFGFWSSGVEYAVLQPHGDLHRTSVAAIGRLVSAW